METGGIVLMTWHESLKKFLYIIFIQHPGKEESLTIAAKMMDIVTFPPYYVNIKKSLKLFEPWFARYKILTLLFHRFLQSICEIPCPKQVPDT